MNICKELNKKSLPLLEAYETDLAIDQKWIEENPCIPFLHYTRVTGTHLIPLSPSNAFPPEGAKVKYLFGKADREHILKSKMEMQTWFESPVRESPKLILYFDGKNLQAVALKKARAILEAYVQTIRLEWELIRKGGCS